MPAVAVNGKRDLSLAGIPQTVPGDYDAGTRNELAWLRSGALQWRDLVSARYPIRETATGIGDIRARKAIKALLDF